MMAIGAIADSGDTLFYSCSLPPSEAERNAIRRHERTGRPLGSDAFLTAIERALGRTLRPAQRGPRPKAPRRKRQS